MFSSKRTYHRIYLTSLAFIGLLVASAMVVIDHITAEESLMVEVNDIGGRQRMLSERVVHLLLEYAAEKNPDIRNKTVKLIERSLTAFNETHKHLIRGNLPSGEHVRFADNIDQLFFGAPDYLDEKARLFIYNTREVLANGWSDELIGSFYLKELRRASKEHLHAQLEKLAMLFTNNSKDRIMQLRITVAFLLSGIILVVIGIGAFVFKPLFRRIVAQEEELQELAYFDSLTNCQNRRSFLKNAEIEFARCRRNDLSFSVLFLDIDYLKKINDTFGHAMGDTAICAIADICQNNLRDIDILGRIGGDEFGILLPECNLDNARQSAERLQQGMSEHSIPGIKGKIKLSFSIGAATLIGSDKNAFETINRADQNLYTAKRTGRNLIIAA